MASQIQIRRDTATNWTSANPILAQGEFGLDLDTKKLKCGDGVTAWSNLNYCIPSQVEFNSLQTEVTTQGQAMGKIKIITFAPESGTIDLDTLTEPCLYRFAGTVSVINDPYDEFMRDQTMLVTGGVMSFQITIKDGEIIYRNSLWNGDFGPWYKITGTVV